MKKIIAGIALIALIGGCLTVGNIDNSKTTAPLAGDRNGLVIC